MLVDDFGTARLAIDVADFHTYSARWQPGQGAILRRRPTDQDQRSGEYPVQMMVMVFDFPAKAGTADEQGAVPGLIVDWVSGG